MPRLAGVSHESDTGDASAYKRIALMVERIVRDHRPLKILSVGSTGRCEACPGHGVDLIVVLPSVGVALATAGGIRGSVRDLGNASDVIVTTPGELARNHSLSGELLRAAMGESPVLYERASRGGGLGRVRRRSTGRRGGGGNPRAAPAAS